jgi:translocation and assembly module TamB
MKKRLILIAVIAVLIVPTGLIALSSNEMGSRWLLRVVFSSFPGQVSVEKIQGRLLDHIKLTGLNYISDTETIIIKDIVFSWQPYPLLSGTLKIDALSLNGLDIRITKPKNEEESSNFEANSIKLPIQLDIGNLLITGFQFARDGQAQSLDKLELVAETVGNQFKILSLAIDSDTVNATANGVVTLEQGFPLNIQASWQVNADNNGLWQGSTTVSGDMYKLVFDNKLTAPFKLALHGQVEEVLKTPRIRATGDWQDLKWPFTSDPTQIQSRQGHIELAGLLDKYQLTINGELHQAYLPQALLTFDGKGSLETMTVNKLELKSSGGLFQLVGNSSWNGIPEFNLSATGQNFNPGIIVPELPGSLTFTSHLKGKFDPKALQITAEINKLTGHIRKQPINANGKLALNGNLLNVDALQIASGANKITADGSVSPTNGTLAVSIDMPALSTLWPTLGGSLKGNGRLQGGWQNPTVKFDAQGNHLRLAEHSSKDLTLNIDYHPDDQITSTINLSANTIKSGTIQVVDKLSIKGKGTPEHHGLNAEIHSSQGSVSAGITGHLRADAWQAEIAKLDAIPKDGNKWSLKNKVPLHVEKKPLGYDITLNEGCLVQQTASLCTQGFYQASGDFGFQLIAKEIPTGLMQAYLPEQMAVKSRINGHADIKRNKDSVDGRYHIDLASALVTVNTNKAKQEIHVGSSSISGNIKGEKISADINLQLAGSDYVQGKLLMDTGKNQAISGNLSASVTEFSMLKPFVPQVSDIKGLLKANLGLQGSINKPLVSGHITVADGLVDMERVGLHDIDLHLVALGNRSNPIQLQGFARPIVLNKPDATEKINLTSVINLDADFQVQDGIAGNFRLALPATTLALESLGKESAAQKQQIVLGATSLTGQIKGESLSADLDMALAGQDYLRGKLQMGIGTSQALSAKVNASVREFAVLESFTPQLANIKGLLKADMTANGTVQNPLVSGNVHLINGAIDVDKLGLTVRDINLQAFTPVDKADRIQLNGTAKSGDGLVDLEGFIGLQPELHYPVELVLTGKDFEVAKLPEAQVAISPNLKLALTNQQKLISGQLEIPKAILKIQDIPENAVKVSEDEVILGEEKAKENNLPLPDINTDIELKLGKQVSFTGQGLQTNLVGNLKIIKAGEKLAVQGKVDMDKASYKRFGQNLTVRKGRFLFNGPANNPWLDVEAVRQAKSKKVTAILALTGTLKNPQTRIYSEPSLPETEALAYLVTGGPLNQVSSSESNMLASAALSYSAGQATWLTDKLGIDEFKVEEGSKLQDTLLVMGQYLTPDFYVGTKVGMFNKQAVLLLKHKLTDNINVESQSGTSQRIKLNYEFDGD